MRSFLITLWLLWCCLIVALAGYGAASLWEDFKVFKRFCKSIQKRK